MAVSVQMPALGESVTEGTVGTHSHAADSCRDARSDTARSRNRDAGNRSQAVQAC